MGLGGMIGNAAKAVAGSVSSAIDGMSARLGIGHKAVAIGMTAILGAGGAVGVAGISMMDPAIVSDEGGQLHPCDDHVNDMKLDNYTVDEPVRSDDGVKYVEGQTARRIYSALSVPRFDGKALNGTQISGLLGNIEKECEFDPTGIEGFFTVNGNKTDGVDYETPYMMDSAIRGLNSSIAQGGGTLLTLARLDLGVGEASPLSSLMPFSQPGVLASAAGGASSSGGSTTYNFTCEQYDARGAMHEHDDGDMVEWNPYWFITHSNTDEGQMIAAAKEGDTMVIDGKAYRVERVDHWSYDTGDSPYTIRDVAGWDSMMMQTCEPGNNFRIVVCKPLSGSLDIPKMLYDADGNAYGPDDDGSSSVSVVRPSAYEYDVDLKGVRIDRDDSAPGEEWRAFIDPSGATWTAGDDVADDFKGWRKYLEENGHPDAFPEGKKQSKPKKVDRRKYEVATDRYALHEWTMLLLTQDWGYGGTIINYDEILQEVMAGPKRTWWGREQKAHRAWRDEETRKEEAKRDARIRAADAARNARKSAAQTVRTNEENAADSACRIRRANAKSRYDTDCGTSHDIYEGDCDEATRVRDAWQDSLTEAYNAWGTSIPEDQLEAYNDWYNNVYAPDWEQANTDWTNALNDAWDRHTDRCNDYWDTYITEWRAAGDERDQAYADALQKYQDECDAADAEYQAEFDAAWAVFNQYLKDAAEFDAKWEADKEAEIDEQILERVPEIVDPAGNKVKAPWLLTRTKPLISGGSSAGGAVDADAYWCDRTEQYYCGLGLGSWTGPGADLLLSIADVDVFKRSFDTSEQKKGCGLTWWNLDYQIAMIVAMPERPDVYEKAVDQCPDDSASGAASWFLANWEGVPGLVGGSARGPAAVGWAEQMWLDDWKPNVNYGDTIMRMAYGIGDKAEELGLGEKFKYPAGPVERYRVDCDVPEHTIRTIPEAFVAMSHSRMVDGQGTSLYEKLAIALFGEDDVTAPYHYESCDRVVAAGLQWSGVDPSFPKGNCETQWAYAKNCGRRWQYLGEWTPPASGDSKECLYSALEFGMQPGDILLGTPANEQADKRATQKTDHSMVFIGNNSEVVDDAHRKYLTGYEAIGAGKNAAPSVVESATPTSAYRYTLDDEEELEGDAYTRLLSDTGGDEGIPTGTDILQGERVAGDPYAAWVDGSSQQRGACVRGGVPAKPNGAGGICSYGVFRWRGGDLYEKNLDKVPGYVFKWRW